MIEESHDVNLPDKNPAVALASTIRCLTSAKGAKLSAISKTSLLGALSIVVLTSCARTAPEPVHEPGLYGTHGWVHGACNNGSEERRCSGEDIDLQVGHPGVVYGPEAWCYPTLSWEGKTTIESGTLPPGMKFDKLRWLGEYGYGIETITGIPTERGHWIVTLRMGTISCNGETYNGFLQEVRFHVTGTGIVR